MWCATLPPCGSNPRPAPPMIPVPQLNGSIKVYNDGAGVPVEVHKEHGVHVPELIFGHLLTSSNYDDKEKKVGLGLPGQAFLGPRLLRHGGEMTCISTSLPCSGDPLLPGCSTSLWAPFTNAPTQVTGGRNGYGAKLANIFSKEFVVETCDGARKRRYKQVSARFHITVRQRHECLAPHML